MKPPAHTDPDANRTAKITVTVPTYNRAGLLKLALQSILAQQPPTFRVVVLDNASTDDTASVVQSFADPRLSLDRSPRNLGMLRNWNRCLQANTSPFLCLFCDDDLMLDGFLDESLALLEAHPDMGFCYARARIIDAEGHVRGGQPSEDSLPTGIMAGADFLERVVAGRPCTIFPSAVVFRAAALAEIGGFDSAHSKVAFDRNMYYRLASRFAVGCLDRELVAAREHPGQESESAFRAPGSRGMIGALGERLDAVAHLLDSPRADDPAYRRWLADRLLMLHLQQSDAIHYHMPGFYWTWAEQLELAKEELARTLPAGAGFILVDEDQWGLGHEFQGRRVWPFTERDGLYWGPPADQATAARELERLRAAGAEFIGFAWTSFWWLDHYEDLDRLLRQQPRVLSSPRLRMYRLR